MTRAATRISSRSAIAALLLAAGLGALGCGAPRPARYVIERDLGDLFYRRYQRTLDVEFVIAGNPAVGHTATYLRRAGGPMAFASAFVTVYERPNSLSAEVGERLATLQHYELSVQELGGDFAWTLARGDEERWAVWVSGRHVIKLGAPRGEALPSELADAYMDLYPSDLNEHGRARTDAPSAGATQLERQQAEDKSAEPALPRSLRR